MRSLALFFTELVSCRLFIGIVPMDGLPLAIFIRVDRRTVLGWLFTRGAELTFTLALAFMRMLFAAPIAAVLRGMLKRTLLLFGPNGVLFPGGALTERKLGVG
tara:strand:- start:93 stop:401 length:309 start_codon:yes stop_codon:yes gene_type:complete